LQLRVLVKHQVRANFVPGRGGNVHAPPSCNLRASALSKIRYDLGCQGLFYKP
jgi:hypothetical protein